MRWITGCIGQPDRGGYREQKPPQATEPDRQTKRERGAVHLCDGDEGEEEQEDACKVPRCDTLRRDARRGARERGDVRFLCRALVIGRGDTEKGCGDGFVVRKEGVVAVGIDGGGGRLVEFRLRFDHLGRFAREGGEVCVHGNDGRAKADIGAYRKCGRENPKGRCRRNEEEEHGGGSAHVCKGEEEWLAGRC